MLGTALGLCPFLLSSHRHQQDLCRLFIKIFFHILALCKKEIVPVHSQMGDWLKPLQWIEYFENQLTDGIRTVRVTI